MYLYLPKQYERNNWLMEKNKNKTNINFELEIVLIKKQERINIFQAPEVTRQEKKKRKNLGQDSPFCFPNF